MSKYDFHHLKSLWNLLLFPNLFKYKNKKITCAFTISQDLKDCMTESLSVISFSSLIFKYNLNNTIK
jgi:hypothetical protein